MEWKDETAMDDVPYEYIAEVLPVCHSLDAITICLLQYFSSRPAVKQLIGHQIVPCNCQH